MFIRKFTDTKLFLAITRLNIKSTVVLPYLYYFIEPNELFFINLVKMDNFAFDFLQLSQKTDFQYFLWNFEDDILPKRLNHIIYFNQY